MKILDILSADDVRHITRLTRLQLTEEEIERMRSQLSGILAHFQSLAQVDTEGVEPAAHSTSVRSVMRDDEPAVSLSSGEALANAPDKEDAFFRVRRILE